MSAVCVILPHIAGVQRTEGARARRMSFFRTNTRPVRPSGVAFETGTGTYLAKDINLIYPCGFNALETTVTLNYLH